ncbi:RSC subunit protein RSC1 KNAG_0D04080 [Huiozyma naganishii CBS 8797]|uniref:BAH domain-containing protein n=1 Tax=Huiozyma naganishii (strain ATCC MYA-139 / BCRC 22969 / CBS 8797 / KCTC 17520 / NBRC 10181 / NCYC 3082 / Yp74L-3) TaxID=1071383 RepID=J7S620_HUIN7|nr:hypothetical protein KNAG_0D04080 [Kazachstania naganishii CBS 8797]CCK70154.1 hypothetical protein KNAG_0D04080 [Kazachstania naganishii CBS 8797]
MRTADTHGRISVVEQNYGTRTRHTMSRVNRGELENLLRQFYKEFFALKEEHGLEIFPIFDTLPPRRDYPDYYTIIRRPVSFNTLKKRVPHYTDPQLFLDDALQIAWNAMVYNTPESDVYKCARILAKHIRESIFPRMREKYPNVRYTYLGALLEPADEALQKAMVDKQEKEDQKNAAAVAKEIPVIEQPKPEQKSARFTTSAQMVSPPPTNSEKGDYYKDHTSSKTRGPKVIRESSVDEYTPTKGRRSKSSTPYNEGKPQRAHIKRGRPPVIDLPYLQRMKNILKALKKERDAKNKPLTTPFERLPAEFENSSLLNIIPNAVSLEQIRKKTKLRKYKDFQGFQNDMINLLNGYRIIYKNNPSMMRSLAKMEESYANFARVELAKPDRFFLPEGAARVPLDEVVLDGKVYRIGDWVLIKNPDDVNKPTIGQIFRLWNMPDGKKWLNACWYFRPEQTVHRVDRLFYKNEVMKTGHYRDSPVDDVVGKCYVIHFTRYQRGDPDVKPEGPLFVCEFRYNEADKVFNKIRTWKACLPEELRDQEEPTVAVLSRKFFKYPSPIRHLLPPNATVHDPIPQAQRGSPNTPPLIGAVYLRPPVERDDLGEYSSSPDCPKYIIRPGDPQDEEGKFDYETGTLTIFIDPNNPPIRPIHVPGRRGRPPNVHLVSERSTPANNDRTNTSDTSGDSMTVQRMKRLQQQQSDLKRRQDARGELSGYADTTVVDNLAAEASKNPMLPVVVDIPNSYILPVSITKNVELLQRADASSDQRRNTNPVDRLYGDKLMRKKRGPGDVLWFTGPSIYIEERLLNSGNPLLDCSLNDFVGSNKKPKLSYDELEEEVVENVRSTRNKKKELLEDQATFFDDLDETVDDGLPEEKEPTDVLRLPGTYVLGLRPSAKFTAFKLQSKESTLLPESPALSPIG